MSLAAHFWTLWPLVREKARPLPPPAAEGWSLEIDDPDVGAVWLSGHLRGAAASRRLVIFVHGLGGSATSRYLGRAVRAADALGLASLRLNLRGADRRGGDLYHAGLSSDLAAVVASPELAAMEIIYLVGFSLGGHVTLKFATELDDPRVGAVAAVCSPLDLERTVDAFDRPRRWPYRRYVLSGLFEIYDEIARHREVPVPPAELRRVRTLREFDRLAIVPRFGFADVEDYYRTAGVGSRLGELKVPALLVAAQGDPMVDAGGIRAALEARDVSPELEVRWYRRGGHVSFPAGFDLGLGPPYGIEAQVLRWLLAAAVGTASRPPRVDTLD